MAAPTSTQRTLRPPLRSLADRDALVLANLPLVKWVAGRLSGRIRTEDADDVVQAGYLGLLRAAQLWDADRGIAFSTYSALAIRNKMLALLASVRRRERLQAIPFDEQRFPVCGHDDLADRDEVERLLAALPRRLAFVVRRSILEERSTADVAAEMGLCRSRVQELVNEGLRRMKERAGRDRARESAGSTPMPATSRGYNLLLQPEPPPSRSAERRRSMTPLYESALAVPTPTAQAPLQALPPQPLAPHRPGRPSASGCR